MSIMSFGFFCLVTIKVDHAKISREKKHFYVFVVISLTHRPLNWVQWLFRIVILRNFCKLNSQRGFGGIQLTVKDKET
jgi:hypothetical protein